jgi:hypothetical protein
MAISVAHGTHGKTGRKRWLASEAADLAVRAFGLVTRASPREDARCAWCSATIQPAARTTQGQSYCSVECAQAVHVAGLYLG